MPGSPLLAFRMSSRTGPCGVTLGIAKGTFEGPLGHRSSAEDRCKLSIDFLPLGNEVFHPLNVKVHSHHLLPAIDLSGLCIATECRLKTVAMFQ
jgi:hypothetical protein